MPIYSAEIGLTYGSRVNVETLTTKKKIMAPRMDFYLYSEAVTTVDNGQTTRGKPYVTWKWDGFIYADMFNAFRALCPGGSADVIIHTLKADYVTYGYYNAMMIWPALDSYEQIATTHDLGYRGFVLRFDGPILYSPPA